MIQIYTDGSCAKNIGGFACLIITGSHHRFISEGMGRCTNNQAELKPIIVGLQHSPVKTHVKITSDSEYCVKGFNSWMHKWQRQGWTRKAGREVKNKELWQLLFALKDERSAEAKWVRGHVHSGTRCHLLNNLCDTMATLAREKQNQVHVEADSYEELINSLYEGHFRATSKASRFLSRYGGK